MHSEESSCLESNATHVAGIEMWCTEEYSRTIRMHSFDVNVQVTNISKVLWTKVAVKYNQLLMFCSDMLCKIYITWKHIVTLITCVRWSVLRSR